MWGVHSHKTVRWKTSSHMFTCLCSHPSTHLLYLSNSPLAHVIFPRIYKFPIILLTLHNSSSTLPYTYKISTTRHKSTSIAYALRSPTLTGTSSIMSISGVWLCCYCLTRNPDRGSREPHICGDGRYSCFHVRIISCAGFWRVASEFFGWYLARRCGVSTANIYRIFDEEWRGERRTLYK
jgi:hypothetical protein